MTPFIVVDAAPVDAEAAPRLEVISDHLLGQKNQS